LGAFRFLQQQTFASLCVEASQEADEKARHGRIARHMLAINLSICTSHALCAQKIRTIKPTIQAPRQVLE
jgi:hypothetical protein